MRKEIEIIEKIVYYGNCPRCMVGQTGRKESHVDILCFKCRKAEEKLSNSMMLAGAVIESVEYMNDDIYKIKIVSPDGMRGTLTTMYDSQSMDYYVGDED